MSAFSLGFNPAHFRPPPLRRTRIWGGEWAGALNDQEIDVALRPLGKARLPARLFFDLARAAISPEEVLEMIQVKLIACGRVYAPVHCRSHWLLARFEWLDADTMEDITVTIMDSAPSVPVRRDVTQLLRTIDPGMIISFSKCPAQRRGSLECGLFVIANTVALVMEMKHWFLLPEASLASLRESTPQFVWGATQRLLIELAGSGQPIVGEGDYQLMDEDIRRIMTFFEPGAIIAVEWDTVAVRSSTWYGVVYEARGRGNARRWPVEFRGRDEDGDMAIVTTTIPPQKKWEDEEVRIWGITRAQGLPPGARLIKPERVHGNATVQKVCKVRATDDQRGATTEDTVRTQLPWQGTTEDTERLGTDDKRGSRRSERDPSQETEVKLWSQKTTEKTGTDDKRGSQRSQPQNETQLLQAPRSIGEEVLKTDESQSTYDGETTMSSPQRGTQQNTEVQLWQARLVDVKNEKGPSQTPRIRKPVRQGILKDKQERERPTRTPRTIDVAETKVKRPVAIDVDAENDENVGSHNEVDLKGKTARPVAIDVEEVVATNEQNSTKMPKMEGNHKENAIDVETETMAKSEWQIADEYWRMAVADSREGALVHGALLDLMITRAYDAAPAAMKGAWEILSVAKPAVPPQVVKTKWMKPISYDRHFVLVACEGDRLTVYDSEPTYARDVRDALVKNIGRNRAFTVINTGPQQLNNCALHTAAAAAKLLGVPVPSPVTDLRRYFMDPIITSMKQRRDALALLLSPLAKPFVPETRATVRLPTYGEHVQQQRKPPTLEHTPPLCEPSPEREEPWDAVADAAHVQRVLEPEIAQLRRHAEGKSTVRLIDDANVAPPRILLEDEDEEFVLAAYPVTHEVAEKLHLDRNTVAGHELTFRKIREAVAATAVKMHPVADKALTKGTRDEHRRVLQYVVLAPTNYDSWSAGKALLEMIMRKRSEKRWKYTTTLKKAASLQGALRVLSLYVAARPIDLTTDPEWVSGVKFLGTKSREERPRAIVSASHKDMQLAVIRADTSGKKVALALAWLVAGRFGDLVTLQHDDISYDPDTATVTVTYRRGKTVSRRGPYTVHSQVPPEWTTMFTIYLRQGKGKLFPALKVADMTKALRQANPKLEARGVRRGSLQRMALAEVTEDVLLLFSGHTSVATLRRYLQWGSIGEAKRKVMTAAAKTLTAPPRVLGGGPRLGSPANKVRRASSEERTPNFLKHLGRQMPPTKEIDNFCGVRRAASKSWPLHLKPAVMCAVDLTKVELLRTGAEREFTTWSEQSTWLTDTARYTALVASGTGRGMADSKVRHNEADLTVMNGCKLEFVAEPQEARGARVFPTDEPPKERRRPIWEPHLNDYFVERPTVRLTPEEEIRRAIAKYTNGYAILLDFAAWYDQFPLTAAVANFLAARLPDGRCIRPRTLPMGFRPSCSIAESLTELIVATTTACLDATVVVYIDNILILARNEETARTVEQRIRDRANTVGAKFNEDVERTADVFEFLGIRYSLVDGTYQLSAKGVDKTRRVRERLGAIIKAAPHHHEFINMRSSRRGMATVFGVAMYASRIVCHRLPREYWPMRYLREMSATTHWDEWAAKAPLMPRSSLIRLVGWFDELLRAPPRPTKAEEDGPEDAIIAVDASGTHWGGVLITGPHVDQVSVAWPHTADYSSSVRSEPKAAWLALCRFVRPEWTKVILYSDHKQLATTGVKGYAKTFVYNELFRQIEETWPHLKCEIRHVPGAENPADELSRGQPLNERKLAEFLTRS